MPGAEIRGSNRGWRCSPADFENEGSAACKSTSHHSLYRVSLLPRNFKREEVSTRKNKSPCRCEQLPSLLPSPLGPPQQCRRAHGFLGIAPEEKPNFAFEWLHWVINSALAFDPKGTGCNFVMLRVELQRRGRIFFPRTVPRREAFSRDPCSYHLSLTALGSRCVCQVFSPTGQAGPGCLGVIYIRAHCIQ